MWTRFFDMSSGGKEKLEHTVIWIEAKERKAVWIFESMFNRSPLNVTCKCCGPDYSIDEFESGPHSVELDEEYWKAGKV